MIKIGKPPYYECSSKGDKRFSAFYAKVNGKSIEEQYQAAKIFEDGLTGLSWKNAKGKKAINMEEISILYKELWKQYLINNPLLLRGLKQQSGLSDMFGQEGHNCQAIVLWELRNEL
jgi:hypothetical protein